MFGNRKKSMDMPAVAGAFVVSATLAHQEHAGVRAALVGAVGEQGLQFADGPIPDSGVEHARAVFALYPDMESLSRLMAQVHSARAARGNGSPVLIIGLAPDALTAFGDWLAAHAERDLLSGLRLLVDSDPEALARAAASKLDPFTGPNMVAMPISTEVETTRFKYFYCISPELRELLAQLADLAANNVERVYLLGGPGAGKTSLAYYFYLARTRGNFVTVNLTAESTDDKAAMKSLLCGHVAGAFPGAGSRTGAFSHARDGVCFLDESHGVSGSVMEVLMEALDSAQYLPYGASAKRPLECAVVFASNRTWDTLVGQINLDEHARLGAIIMHLADLSVRREDLIAVLADTLARLARKATSWKPPPGLTDDAWAVVRDAPWRGNTRALIRVVETAFVDCASHGGALIDEQQIHRAMALWEPTEHASHKIYTTAKTSGLGDAGVQ